MARKATPREQYLAKATARHVRVSPRKARMVLNMVKGKQVEPALQILRFTKQKSAKFMLTLLNSAISNAKEHKSADVDKLWITGGSVDMGRVLKRYMPGAHGRANPVRKRSAHVTILLSEKR